MPDCSVLSNQKACDIVHDALHNAQSEPNPAEAARALCKAALQAESTDNICASVMLCNSLPPTMIPTRRLPLVGANPDRRHALCVLPRDAKPGDQLVVPSGSDGQQLLTTVPLAVQPGMILCLSQGGEEAAACGYDSLVACVPEGIQGGDVVRVEASWGDIFEVRVPESLHAGELFEVELTG